MHREKFSPNTTTTSRTPYKSRAACKCDARLLFFSRLRLSLHKFRFFSCIVFLGLLSPSSLKAATFTVTSSSTLSAVLFSELGLSGTGTAYSEGSYDANVTWGGVVSSPLPSFDQVYTGSSVQRVDVLLWYYQFNKNTETQPTFTPTYRIFSKTGSIENKLSNSTYTSNTVNATITTQPIITSKYSGTTYRSYGYATITIDLTSARRSGTYQGTVQISIIYI
jgi:hypothetical protein